MYTKHVYAWASYKSAKKGSVCFRPEFTDGADFYCLQLCFGGANETIANHASTTWQLLESLRKKSINRPAFESAETSGQSRVTLKRWRNATVVETELQSKCICRFHQNDTPNVGLEPTTPRLRVSCSTDWASRAVILAQWLWFGLIITCPDDMIRLGCELAHFATPDCSSNPGMPSLNGTQYSLKRTAFGSLRFLRTFKHLQAFCSY